MTLVRVCSCLLAVAVLSCGGSETEATIDTSLGLDARPNNDDCIGSGDFPERLSEHACFESEPPRVSDAFVPYAVNAPLWSDGAGKDRYIALPNDTAMEVQRNGNFELPPGGTLVKEFVIGDRYLETRLLTRDEDGEWHAATYVWNDDQDDAELTTDGDELEVEDGAWGVPNQDECFECHTEAAGVSLGLNQRQMARELKYDSTGRKADQVHTLTGLGMLEGESDDEPLVAPDDEEADLDERARSYLHANCGHCHRPGGLGEGEIDLRVTTPFRLTETCNAPPMHGDPVGEGSDDENDEEASNDGDDSEAQDEENEVLQDAVIVAPGAPEASALYLRMISGQSSWRMPPLGTGKVDEKGSELIEAWIESLEECPE